MVHVYILPPHIRCDDMSTIVVMNPKTIEEAIKLVSCSTQLSLEFILLINVKNVNN